MDDVIHAWRRSRLCKHACMFNDRAGSAASGSVQHACCVNATGAGWTSLQHPVWRSRDLIVEETHGISNSIPFVADISMERLHQHVNDLHHYGVEGTTACQQGSWIHSIRRHSSSSIATSTTQEEELGTPQIGSDVEEHGRLHTGAASWSTEELTFSNTRVESSINSNNSSKHYQVFTQVFIKPATA